MAETVETKVQTLRNMALVGAVMLMSAAAWAGYARVERARLAKDPDHILQRLRMVGGL